jgi:hypothetical protein
LNSRDYYPLHPFYPLDAVLLQTVVTGEKRVGRNREEQIAFDHDQSLRAASQRKMELDSRIRRQIDLSIEAIAPSGTRFRDDYQPHHYSSSDPTGAKAVPAEVVRPPPTTIRVPARNTHRRLLRYAEYVLYSYATTHLQPRHTLITRAVVRCRVDIEQKITQSTFNTHISRTSGMTTLQRETLDRCPFSSDYGVAMYGAAQLQTNLCRCPFCGIYLRFHERSSPCELSQDQVKVVQRYNGSFLHESRCNICHCLPSEHTAYETHEWVRFDQGHADIIGSMAHGDMQYSQRVQSAKKSSTNTTEAGNWVISNGDSTSSSNGNNHRRSPSPIDPYHNRDRDWKSSKDDYNHGADSSLSGEDDGGSSDDNGDGNDDGGNGNGANGDDDDHDDHDDNGERDDDDSDDHDVKGEDVKPRLSTPKRQTNHKDRKPRVEPKCDYYREELEQRPGYDPDLICVRCDRTYGDHDSRPKCHLCIEDLKMVTKKDGDEECVHCGVKLIRHARRGYKITTDMIKIPDAKNFHKFESSDEFKDPLVFIRRMEQDARLMAFPFDKWVELLLFLVNGTHKRQWIQANLVDTKLSWGGSTGAREQFIRKYTKVEYKEQLKNKLANLKNHSLADLNEFVDSYRDYSLHVGYADTDRRNIDEFQKKLCRDALEGLHQYRYRMMNIDDLDYHEFPFTSVTNSLACVLCPISPVNSDMQLHLRHSVHHTRDGTDEETHLHYSTLNTASTRAIICRLRIVLVVISICEYGVCVHMSVYVVTVSVPQLTEGDVPYLYVYSRTPHPYVQQTQEMRQNGSGLKEIESST